MKAHPTTYGGVNFRSRLEAKWAAFFDELGWKWQYEPIDFEGWVPDFSIATKDGPIYVEVKPIEWRGTMDDNVKQARERTDLAKVGHYITTHKGSEVLILGVAPSYLGVMGEPEDIFLGVLARLDVLDNTVYVEPSRLFRSRETNKIDFNAYYGSYHFRISGEYDGDGHLWPHLLPIDEVDTKWRAAGNKVQWKPAA